MNIADLVPRTAVVVPLNATDVDGVLVELGSALADAHGLSAQAVIDRLRERERLGTTALGDAIALPHGRGGVSRTHAALGISSRGIAWDSPDGAPVHIVIAMLSPNEGPEHLGALAAVSRRLSDPGVRDALRSSTSPREAHAALLRGHLPAK